MAINLEELFVLGISSSALFDTAEGEAIFKKKGLPAFIEYQIANEETPFGKGPAFPLIEALLRVNQLLPKRLMEVIVLSHNDPAAGLRAMNSIEKHGLDITRAAFVSDAPIANYLKAYHTTLFLSRNPADVRDAIDRGVAAGLLLDQPADAQFNDRQLRIAFDADSVLFSDQSDRVYAEGGIQAFRKFERENKNVMLPPGPFADVLRWIARIQAEAAKHNPNDPVPVRTAIVTARNDVAVQRVIRTLRAWKVAINEIFFLGDIPKTEIVAAFQPHIFFDDQMKNAGPTSKKVPSALVPYGVTASQTATVSTETPVRTAAKNVPAPEPATSSNISAREEPALVGMTKKDFEARSRSIFRSYTPLSTRGPLDDRYRRFVADHANRTAIERAKLIAALEKYDLTGVATHDPMLNRELGDIVTRKLSQAEAEALGAKQSEFGL